MALAKGTAPRFVLLALDPSYTATGWVAVDLATGRVIACGLIRTKPAKSSERLTAAQDAARRGALIRRAITTALEDHEPLITVQEGSAGSKNAKAAKGLARAQQACVDAIDVALDALPMIVTPQHVKKECVGNLSASKDDLQAAALEAWGDSLRESIKTYCIGARLKFPDAADEGGAKVLENIYDAGCVASSVWTKPEVVALRRLAKESGRT